MGWIAATDTSPFRIVSEKAAVGNIPEGDCCGEAVESRNELRRPEESRSGLRLNVRAGIEFLQERPDLPFGECLAVDIELRQQGGLRFQ